MDTDNQGIYDAKSLGKTKFMVLGIQHLFAMFGATILVPLITGLDVSATLLFAGIGTLIFHLLSKMKVPAFLGSSFAFLGGYASVKQLCVAQGLTDEMALNYACLGVAAASLLYFAMAFLLKMFGTEKVMRFFPACSDRPNGHCHRTHAVRLSHQQLPAKLAAGHSGNCHCHKFIHLGQRHHQNSANPSWRAWFIHIGSSSRRSRLLQT